MVSGYMMEEDITKESNSVNKKPIYDFDKFNEYQIVNKNVTNIFSKNSSKCVNVNNLIDYLFEDANTRNLYEIKTDNISTPSIIVPNIFVKINKFFDDKDKIKNFIKNLVNLENTYFLRKNNFNINLDNIKNSEPFILCEEDISKIKLDIYEKQHFESRFNEISLENFCKGKFSIYNVEDLNQKLSFNLLNPRKKELVFNAMLKLLNEGNLSDNEKKLLVSLTWSLNEEIIKLINGYDFYGNVPKIIEISNENNILNNILMLLLNELAFDIISISPSNNIGIESKIDIPILTLEEVSTINIWKLICNNNKKKFNLEIIDFPITIGLILYIVVMAIFKFHLLYSNNGFQPLFIVLDIVFGMCMFDIWIQNVPKEKLEYERQIENYKTVVFFLFIITAIVLLIIPQKPKIIDGKLDINEEYVSEYSFTYDDTEHSIITANTFILYENKLYGYIYSPYNKLNVIKGSIYYNDEKIYDDLIIDSASYLKYISVNLTKKDIIDGFPITFIFKDTGYMIKFNANVVVANTEQELYDLMINYQLNQ